MVSDCKFLCGAHTSKPQANTVIKISKNQITSDVKLGLCHQGQIEM